MNSVEKNVTTILRVNFGSSANQLHFRSYGLWFKSVFSSWKIALFFPSFIAGDISGTNANYHAQLQESKRHHYWSYIKQTGGRAMSFTIRNYLVHRQLAWVSECHSHGLSVPGKWTNMNNTHLKSCSEFEGKSINYHKSDVLHKKGQMHFRIFNRVVAVLPPRSMGSIFSDMGSKTTGSIPWL